MSIHRAVQPAAARSVRDLRLPRWLLPVLIGVGWLWMMYRWGSPAALQWAGANIGAGALLLLSGAALFLVPGLAVLHVLWPERALPWLERCALAGGVSIALPPLLLHAAHLLGVRWNGAATWIYVAGMALLFAVQLARRRRLAAERVPFSVSWHGPVVAALVAAALLVQLFVVRDLPVGMWGDSYHHTMIAQLLVDNGGVFSSWQPYASLSTFTYHWGFHANAAFFHWITGLPVPQSVIFAGQFINVVSIAGAYALAAGLSGNRAVGVWAVALTAFANMLPVYFVNWGRYTQLAGQALLPALVLCWFAVLQTRRLSWRRSVLAIGLTASLMLTHYVVTIFAALFVLALLPACWLANRSWRTVGRVAGRSVLMGGLALLVAAPWLWTVFGGYLARNVARYAGGSDVPPAALGAFLPVVPLYVSLPVVVLAALGMIIVLLQRRWWMLLFVAWTMLVLVSTNPQVVGLPGHGVVNMPAAYMALYVIVVPLAAYAAHNVVQLAAAQRARIATVLAVVVMLGTGVWGVRQQEQILDSKYMLFTPADADAMEWIKANTDPHDRFLVDMFPAYNDSLFVGSDGGWWIPLLTGRPTTLPPITYVNERTDPADYRAEVDAFAWALRQHPLPGSAGIDLLRRANIRYIYSGARVDGTRTIDPAVLRAAGSLRVVYDRDGVVIFALTPNNVRVTTVEPGSSK